MAHDTHDPRTAEPELWRHMGPHSEGRVARGRSPRGVRHGGGHGGGTVAAAAVVTVAGLAALALMTGRRPPRDAREEPEGHADLEVERSLPVASGAADDLARRFGEAETLARIAGRFATVSAAGGGRTSWTTPALGTWTMRRTETDGTTRWEAEDAAAPLQELSLRVRPARGGRGSVATIGVRGNPPAGVLGRAAAHALGGLLPAAFATGVLYAFKALVETGEVPTIDPQPAGRKQQH